VIQTGTNSPVIYYLCKDHLGSITGIMNSNGNMLKELNYDPWGKRRNPQDWSYTNVTASTYTERGFTGHEHLDSFGLINMNGRIFDPEISRFLSPDPVVQNPYNILNYNRYSYCLNNPLKYTDPSGFLYNPGFNSRMWQLIASLWNRTPQGEDLDFTPDGSGGWQGIRSGSGFQGPNMPYMLGEVTVASKKPVKNRNVGKDPIDLYLSTYGDGPRAGDYIDLDAINGVAGTLNLLNKSADKTLRPMKMVTSSAGLLLTFINVLLITSDKNIKGNLSYGDKGRIGLNAFFGIADAACAFVGFIPAVMDSFGLFEPFYQSLDVYEDTGY